MAWKYFFHSVEKNGGDFPWRGKVELIVSTAWKRVGACGLRLGGGVVTAGLLGACAGLGPGEPLVPRTVRAQLAEPAPLPDPPPEGYAWDDLARRAAERSAEAHVLRVEAIVQPFLTAAQTAWPDPQLRLGRAWQDADDASPGSDPREWGRRSADSYDAALRANLSNPFVNRWRRIHGEAVGRALEAEALEASTRVFHQVRSWCLDAATLEQELRHLEQIVELRAELRDVRSRQASAGVAGALELIQAVARHAATRSDLRDKQADRRSLLRQMATHVGIPEDQIRLRPLSDEPLPDVSRWTAETLAERALSQRPDALRLRHRVAAAEYERRVAQAGGIPWFTYVEAAYADEATRIDSYRDGGTGASRTDRDSAEWQLRLAVTLPIFGGHVDRLRAAGIRQAAAQARLAILEQEVRNELAAVLTELREALAERDRIVDENRQVLAIMQARLDGLADEPAVRPEELIEAREAMAAYLRIGLRAERRVRRLAHRLEALVGRSLTDE